MGEDDFGSQHIKQIEQCLTYKSLRKVSFIIHLSSSGKPLGKHLSDSLGARTVPGTK